MYSPEFLTFYKNTISCTAFARIMQMQTPFILSTLDTLSTTETMNELVSEANEDAKKFGINFLTELNLKDFMNHSKVELMTCEIWLCKGVMCLNTI